VRLDSDGHTANVSFTINRLPILGIEGLMAQLPLFDHSATCPPLDGGLVSLHRDFLSLKEAEHLYQALLDLPGWKLDQIRIFGRIHDVPRLHRWFATSTQAYRWSGITMIPEPFPSALELIRGRISALAQTDFNSALGNLYRDGHDSVSWHADDEAELGTRPVIASLSLGATRRFLLRRKDDHNQKAAFDLSAGSLLIMAGDTQRYWEHCVPKTGHKVGPRINVTFRDIQSIP